MEEEGEEEESPPAPYQLERPILLGIDEKIVVKNVVISRSVAYPSV